MSVPRIVLYTLYLVFILPKGKVFIFEKLCSKQIDMGRFSCFHDGDRGEVLDRADLTVGMQHSSSVRSSLVTRNASIVIVFALLREIPLYIPPQFIKFVFIQRFLLPKANGRYIPLAVSVFWLAVRVQLSRISLYLASGNRLFRNDAYRVSVISINNTLY